MAVTIEVHETKVLTFARFNTPSKVVFEHVPATGIRDALRSAPGQTTSFSFIEIDMTNKGAGEFVGVYRPRQGTYHWAPEHVFSIEEARNGVDNNDPRFGKLDKKLLSAWERDELVSHVVLTRMGTFEAMRLPQDTVIPLDSLIRK